MIERQQRLLNLETKSLQLALGVEAVWNQDIRPQDLTTEEASASYGVSQSLAHALAICQRYFASDDEKRTFAENGYPVMPAEVSLLSDTTLQLWQSGSLFHQKILKSTVGAKECPSRLVRNEYFRSDLKKAIDHKAEAIKSRLAGYQHMEKKVEELTNQDPFEVLETDTEVFMDFIMHFEGTQDERGRRRQCKLRKSMSRVARREGAKEFVKEAGLTTASFFVNPEMAIVGTLGKAGLNLEKIENLLQRLWVMSKNDHLSPRALKDMAQNTRLMKDLNVEAEVVRELPTILRDRFKMGYGEFMERIGLSKALNRSARGAHLTDGTSIAYRNSLVERAQELAGKGVSINPNRLNRLETRARFETRDEVDGIGHTIEDLVSKGVYPDEPRELLNQINQEFPGGYREFLQYVRRYNRR
jgi:hypothetical protein